jgi:molybdenum cofactor cytidylyltransferase
MTVCILLAAGSSSRMQSSNAAEKPIPKMLLSFNGKTLLQHAVDEITKVDETKLLVVTGCYHSILQEILSAQHIAFIENKNWQDGMGHSIQKAVLHVIEKYANAESIIILVCDQPYISSDLLQQLISTKKQSGKGIIASFYNEIYGTPVLFDKLYFEQLALLDGKAGAKKIVDENIRDVDSVPFPLGGIDIDTLSDYIKLKSKEGKS